MRHRKMLAAGFALLAVCLGLLLPVQAQARNYAKAKYKTNRWEWMKKDFLNTDTDRLIFVKYKGGSKAAVEMWKKVEVITETVEGEEAAEPVYTWKRILAVNGYVGKNGINKKREGDKKTPTGTFHITAAFGIKKSPGTAGISYKKINKYHYWSGEKATYNTFVDVRKIGRKSIAGEHLIDYVPFYHYGLTMDFNKECVYKKGSAIFFHCTKPGRKYTAGCVAIPESKMKKVVKNTTKHTMIFIYQEK